MLLFNHRSGVDEEIELIELKELKFWFLFCGIFFIKF